MRKRTAILTILILFTWNSARATKPSAVQIQRKHFQRGQTAYRLTQFAKALAEYEAALKAKHHPVILFNIAQCHRQLKQYNKALFFYKLYLSERPKASNRRMVERLIAKLKRAIGNVGRLSVVTTPPGATLYLDQSGGKPAGVAPRSCPCVPVNT